MHNPTSVTKLDPNDGPERVHKRVGDSRPGRPGYANGRFFRIEVEDMSPKAQVTTALAVLVPVLLSGLLLVALAPALWWIFTTYGWVAFPSFGLLLRGISGSANDRATAGGKERELLEALRREGELTPVLAALGTSLTVAEADRMLGELAEGGHLEVRVRGGGLSYALWE